MVVALPTDATFGIIEVVPFLDKFRCTDRKYYLVARVEIRKIETEGRDSAVRRDIAWMERDQSE